MDPGGLEEAVLRVIRPQWQPLGIQNRDRQDFPIEGPHVPGEPSDTRPKRGGGPG